MKFFRYLAVKLVNFFLLEANFFYDYIAFKKWVSKASKPKKERKELEGWILQDKHRLEKGFTLPVPRLQFGREVMERLAGNLLHYKTRFGEDIIYFIGIGAIAAYERYHVERKSLPDFLTQIKKRFAPEDFLDPRCSLAGYDLKLSRPTKNFDSLNFAELTRIRRSCRSYDKVKSAGITSDILRNIVEMAITAPSVCNRQHWHVHFFKGDDVGRVLKYQNGSSGFNDRVPFLALITSDLRAFYTDDERNQSYTDGGLFAMNLIYAIQSMGLESCPLNWCNSFVSEIKFRRLGLIPPSEIVVMALAFGVAADSAIYAKSPRLPVESFYSIH